MAKASSKSYKGWENFKSQRCKICGAEMVHIMVAIDKIDRYGKQKTEFIEELECSNCGKTAPKGYKNTKQRKRRQWR